MMRDRLQRFMMGRYGIDSLSKFLLGIVLVCWFLNMIFGNRILYSWCVILVVYVYYRMFSRQIVKRQMENMKFLSIKSKLLSKLKLNKTQFQQHKTHHIYKCPVCKQKIRIPRGKGRICITCPKCKNEFTKIS